MGINGIGIWSVSCGNLGNRKMVFEFDKTAGNEAVRVVQTGFGGVVYLPMASLTTS